VTTKPAPASLVVRKARPAEHEALLRMLELYQHDLSDLWDQDLDENGEYGYDLEPYWERSPPCLPFVFLVDDCYAGLALVDDSVRLPGGDHWMAQFFVLRKYRRRGIGAEAARQIFDGLRGRWQVGQMPGNQAALAFWRRVIGGCTGGRFEDLVLDDERWRGTLQCFDNRE
jgi:predicted acetyltransferase